MLWYPKSRLYEFTAKFDMAVFQEPNPSVLCKTVTGEHMLSYVLLSLGHVYHKNFIRNIFSIEVDGMPYIGDTNWRCKKVPI
jgi:hypothetical protein